MKLHIDTSEIHTLIVTVGSYKKTAQSIVMRSQMVLPLIEDLLSEHALTFADITEITVVTGPGSFTGLRVGAAVANALGFLLGVPVNGKRSIVIPSY